MSMTYLNSLCSFLKILFLSSVLKKELTFLRTYVVSYYVTYLLRAVVSMS